MHQPEIQAIVRNDARYAYEAYEFLFEALTHTQKMLGKLPDAGDREPGPQYHVSGPELLRGACDLARRDFGLMAKVVFHLWGLRRTDDVGAIVFNLIEAGLLSKTDTDSRDDFRDVFDLDRALEEGFRISLADAAPPQKVAS
jgi:uncharacterized repeat protein (TIGR04138 family)